MVRLQDVLMQVADGAIALQASDGSLPAGVNGPWANPQTPVRNTGHWLVTFLECYDRSGQERYRDAAQAAVGKLTSTEARPYGYTFSHLPEHELSRCNGLIGQAWTIEALLRAADDLDRPDLVSLAEEVFTLHPFDTAFPAWHYVDVDGEFGSLDKTFNHQLWFAMAGAMLSTYPETDSRVRTQVSQFMDALPENMTLYDSGLVYHHFKPEFDVRKYAKIFTEGVKSGVARKMVSKLLRGRFGEADSDPTLETSVGYHSFNMYALGVLKSIFPDHSFWDSELFHRALDYARSDEFKRALDGNPYGFPYNCSGIEMAYVLEVFGDDDRDAQQWWLRQQFQRTFAPEEMMMAQNNPDPPTLTARLYEATRLPDIEIPLESDDELPT